MSFSIIVMGASGRMGASIINVARDKGLQIDAVVDRSERAFTASKYDIPVESDLEQVLMKHQKAVVIDFTEVEYSMHVAKVVSKYGNPLVIGTTGFSVDQISVLETLAETTRLFWAPNMSIGITALLEVLPELTKRLGEAYDIELVELHHNKKKDAPSGTALRLADAVASARHWDLNKVACYHREGITGERPKYELGIQTVRGGDVVGVHTVYFMGHGERIEITHQAQSRDNFAQGSLLAAKWLIEQNAGRLYTMTDIVR